MQGKKVEFVSISGWLGECTASWWRADPRPLGGRGEDVTTSLDKWGLVGHEEKGVAGCMRDGS